MYLWIYHSRCSVVGLVQSLLTHVQLSPQPRPSGVFWSDSKQLCPLCCFSSLHCNQEIVSKQRHRAKIFTIALPAWIQVPFNSQQSYFPHIGHLTWMPSSLPDHFSFCKLPGMVEDTELKESNLLTLPWRKKKKRNSFFSNEGNLPALWVGPVLLAILKSGTSIVCWGPCKQNWLRYKCAGGKMKNTLSLCKWAMLALLLALLCPHSAAGREQSAVEFAGLPPRPAVACPHHPTDFALPLPIPD